ncbi:MAG: type II toxin-antitoxin system PemK/MazF family toxin [Limisphaerales bacterium]
MSRPQPGEVWWVDFGMAAKVRPALVMSEYPRDEELALVVVVPHTTAVRGNRWELALPKPFLKPGVFHLQQLQPMPLVRFEARLGVLSTEEFQRVKAALVRVLSLESRVEG